MRTLVLSHCVNPLIIRPPDILVGGTYVLLGFFFSFFFLSFFRHVPSELAKRNSTKIGHMVGSKCNLKMRVQNLGYFSPTNRGPKTALFRRLRNLTATVTAYIFRMKHYIHNRASALETTKGLLPSMWLVLGEFHSASSEGW